MDVIYPRENESLYYQIRNNGLLISEYPPLADVTRQTFPERNRIISGISDGVFVIEAGKDSGALITADRALYQGKNLYALPGNINSAQSVGTNRLIQNGAKLVTEANDIIVEHQHDAKKELVPVMKRDLERLRIEKEQRSKESKRKNAFSLFVKKDKNASKINTKAETKASGDNTPMTELLSNKEKMIFNSLDFEPMSTDLISKKSGLSVPEVSAMLTMLVIKGMVERLPGDRYIRTKKG